MKWLNKRTVTIVIGVIVAIIIIMSSRLVALPGIATSSVSSSEKQLDLRQISVSKLIKLF